RRRGAGDRPGEPRRSPSRRPRRCTGARRRARRSPVDVRGQRPTRCLRGLRATARRRPRARGPARPRDDLRPGLCRGRRAVPAPVTARRWDRVGLGAAGLGGAFRLLFGLVLHPPLHYEYSDMADYVSRAALAAKHAPLAHYDAYHPPGTYLLLQVPFRLFGTRHTGHWAATVLWAALSALAPLFMWLFARRLLTPAAAAIATALVAFWPLRVTLGGCFLSEVPVLPVLLL